MSRAPATGGVRISAVLMHHPARASYVPRLVEGCAPLALRVIADPEPEGYPSPLRTAKRAWAAVDPDATHHLVLQDDVVLRPDFARRLVDAVSVLPDYGVAGYVSWDSPQNSYLTRLAVAAGSPWAPLSRYEWTPAQGFLLPADAARELAEFLAPVPDEVQDDDELITVFCREQGVPVVATVPNLLDHGDHASLTGHDSHGARRATVRADDAPLGPDHWRAAPAALPALAARGQRYGAREFTVELRNSRCLLRFLRPRTAGPASPTEPVEHPYGWYWHDWCSLIDVDPTEVLDAGAAHLAGGAGPFTNFAGMLAAGPRPVPVATAMECWAAGYLLGVDAGRNCRDSAGGAGGTAGAGALPERLLTEALRTWVDSGLRPEDAAALGDVQRATLAALCVAGCRAGQHRAAVGQSALVALER